MTAFLAYIGRFYGRLDSMSRIVSVTQKAASGAKRIFDILDHHSNVPEPTQPVVLDKVEGELSLQDIGFRYGNRTVIRDLNLVIKPGEMIGLVGHSGSGKSTMVNLICRFYDVTEGAIKLDGVDLRRFRLSDFRRHIGLVLQEPFLFFGTIAENIAYGKPEATRDEIVAAARAAHAHEFILRLPQGYDSLVGERGQGLSGGERQRISIARALLIDPRILIMDEATSAVDTETEKEIQKALDNLVRGRTTIAIAHRAVDAAQGRPAGGHGPRRDRRGRAARRADRQAGRLPAPVGGAGPPRRCGGAGQRGCRRAQRQRPHGHAGLIAPRCFFMNNIQTLARNAYGRLMLVDAAGPDPRQRHARAGPPAERAGRGPVAGRHATGDEIAWIDRIADLPRSGASCSRMNSRIAR